MALGKIGSGFASGIAGASMLAFAHNPALAEDKVDNTTTGSTDNQYSVQIPKEVMDQILANYQDCIGEVIADIDELREAAGVTEQDIADVVDYGKDQCAKGVDIAIAGEKKIQTKLAKMQADHEDRMKAYIEASEARIAASKKRTQDQMNAILAGLFEGALKEQGLK